MQVWNSNYFLYLKKQLLGSYFEERWCPKTGLFTLSPLPCKECVRVLLKYLFDKIFSLQTSKQMPTKWQHLHSGSYLRGILGKNSVKGKHLWGGQHCSSMHWGGLCVEWGIVEGQLFLTSVHLQEGQWLRWIHNPQWWTNPHHHFDLEQIEKMLLKHKQKQIIPLTL